jgi:hypothetical protein
LLHLLGAELIDQPLDRFDLLDGYPTHGQRVSIFIQA